jgi:hypothetical protein
MSMTGAIRPRSGPEIVDGAIQVVRQHYLPLVTITTIGYVPFVVIQIVAFRGVLAAAAGTTRIFPVRAWGLGPGLYFAFAILWGALIDLTLIMAAADAHAGGSIDIAGVFRRALPHAGPTLVAIVIKYVLIAIFAALCVTPLAFLAAPGSLFLPLFAVVVCALIYGALYLLALLFVTTPAIALEGRGPIAGVRRSVALSRTHVRHIMVAMVLAYLIYFVGQSPSFILAAGGARTVVQFLSVATTILLFPIVSVTRMLTYYDARIRVEGYDLELMAQSIAVTGAP